MRLIDADELKKCVLKWLPQDPCGREEKEFPFETDICVSMLMEIDEQPTIIPEPHWIPCSERLPQDEDEVLVMMADGEFMDVGWVDFYGWWHVNSDINGDWEERKDISAWQTLPEPYKEVTE